MPYHDSNYERSWKMQTKGVTLYPVKPEDHTPGPWFCHAQASVFWEYGDYVDATCITTADEEEYARTALMGDMVAWVPHDRRHGPNARLIAAAPELLAACKRVRELDAGDQYWSRDRYELASQMMAAAIAKAEGRDE